MTVRLLPHLARRFFGAIRDRRPGPGDQLFLAGELTGPAGAWFHAQQAIDQAHGLRVAHRVATAAPGRSDLVRAALLHDIGKAESSLRVPGRVAASLLGMLGIPAPGRLARYLAHGPLGAEMLAAAGEAPVVVAFARFHDKAAAPSGVDPADWELLRRADHE